MVAVPIYSIAKKFKPMNNMNQEGGNIYIIRKGKIMKNLIKYIIVLLIILSLTKQFSVSNNEINFMNL